MEGASGDDHEEPTDQPPSKKRYHRHTLLQIQQMEMVFKDCPHPDEQQRQELSRELGLEPRQVKFWFQNRRTQMKAHHERADNSMLRAENERLQIENIALREALKNATCPQCGGPVKLGEMSFDEQQLRVENARLKDELNRISALLSKFSAPNLPVSPNLPALPFAPFAGAGMPLAVPSVLELATRAGGLTDAEKQLVAELAITAMEELIAVCQASEPLWTSDGALNQEEYARTFPRGLGSTALGMKFEATRDTALVMMSAASLIDNIMNADRWLNIFSSMVARALTTEVLTTGGGNDWNNALQLMYAELQVLSPLVPTREVFFLRYCKRTEKAWAVVDVSVGALRETLLPHLRCRLRPSGFLIEEVRSGCSKVTILQHFDADDRGVNNLYKELVNSGMAFGARRWLATLQRQAERMVFKANAMPDNSDLGVIPNDNGRQSMLKLAQRMTSNFCAGVGASTAHSWITLSGTSDDDVRVMTRKSFDNPGEPHGIVLSAATSLWLPVHPQRLFDFLRDERLRSEWDILSNGGSVQAISRITEGQDSGNAVSLLRVNAVGTSPSNMLILQESSTDAFGSLIVYAPVDIPAMNLVLQGEDPCYVALLPSGFAITPDGPQQRVSGGASSSSGGGSGSLLTVAFQIIVPTAKVSLDSVATINSLISCTVQRIKAALGCY